MTLLAAHILSQGRREADEGLRETIRSLNSSLEAKESSDAERW